MEWKGGLICNAKNMYTALALHSYIGVSLYIGSPVRVIGQFDPKFT